MEQFLCFLLGGLTYIAYAV